MNVVEVVAGAQERLAEFTAPDPNSLEAPQLSLEQTAALIGHTLLKPEATGEEIRLLCKEARQYGFASVCVNAAWMLLCQELLEGSRVRVCIVVGFPLGATLTSVKVFEANAAVEAGAGEIDMVLNIGALRGGDYELVAHDIRAVVDAAKQQGALVKVIFETCLLSDEEKAMAAALSVAAGADFVKTSTGFNAGGATIYDVALMRHMVGMMSGVKASSRVRSSADLQRMVAVGATRIGTSTGVKIIEGLRQEMGARQTFASIAIIGEDY